MTDLTEDVEKVKDKFNNLIATLDPAILPEDEVIVNDIFEGLNKIKGKLTVNHFKTALNDPEVLQSFEGKPFHMAVLNALSAYIEKGHKLSELPWFLNK